MSKATDDLKLILDAFGLKWRIPIAKESQLRKLKQDFDKAGSLIRM
jgi:hypothetical protein